jgi:RNA polymerase sigma-70 factor (ECF subfamily)
MLKAKYRSDFERAMAEALATLDERDRIVLRMHVVSGVSVTQIGQMFGVSQSTASRWLADAREKIQSEMLASLRSTDGLQSTDVRSMAGLVASQLDLDLLRLLPAGAAQPPK